MSSVRKFLNDRRNGGLSRKEALDIERQKEKALLEARERLEQDNQQDLQLQSQRENRCNTSSQCASGFACIGGKCVSVTYTSGRNQGGVSGPGTTGGCSPSAPGPGGGAVEFPVFPCGGAPIGSAPSCGNNNCFTTPSSGNSPGGYPGNDCGPGDCCRYDSTTDSVRCLPGSCTPLPGGPDGPDQPEPVNPPPPPGGGDGDGDGSPLLPEPEEPIAPIPCNRCPEGLECNGTACAPIPCGDDFDCPGAFDCRNGACLPVPGTPDEPIPCGSDPDCPDGFSCVGGECLPDNLPCNAPEDCPTGYNCQSGECIPGPIPCGDSSECPSNYNCVDGECVPDDIPCSGNPDCPSGFSCADGKCVPDDIPCAADPDCPRGSSCVDGTCLPGPIPCEEDPDCPGGFLCEEGGCQPDPLAPPGGCAEGTCDNATCVCADGFKCSEGSCVPDPFEAPPEPDPDFPDGEGPPILPDEPIPCNSDPDCPGGSSCVGGECLPDPDCPEGGYPGNPGPPEDPCNGPDVPNPPDGPPEQPTPPDGPGSSDPDDPNGPPNPGAPDGSDGGDGGFGPIGGLPPAGGECNGYCDSYKDLFGEDAPNCSPEDSCDECTECQSGSCKEKFGAIGPCWCNPDDCGYNGNECQVCDTNPESGTYGECTYGEDCSKCATVFGPCCPGETITATACASMKEYGSFASTQAMINAYKKLDLLCSEDKKKNCPPDPDEPEPCDCNCDNDCPECFICNAAGKCEPDPECENVYFTEYAWSQDVCTVGFTWDITQPIENRCNLGECPGSASFVTTVEYSNSGKIGEVEPGLSWSSAVTTPYTCNNNGCPDIEPPDKKTRTVLLEGASVGVTVDTVSATCPGSFFSSISINYNNVGVVVGFGKTPGEADADAQSKLP